jgi:hypothetical protein
VVYLGAAAVISPGSCLVMKKLCLSLLSLVISCCTFANPVIYLNQVAFDSNSPKVGVLQFDNKLTRPFNFNLVNVATGRVAYTGMLTHPETITDWLPGKLFFQADFSAFKTAGKYRLRIKYEGLVYTSYPFEIGENMVAKRTLSAIIHYYNKQRANTPGELAADAKMQLFGSNQRVDLRGGWCDASGDVSKYFSHLAYANYFSPQQTPLVTWSMVSASEAIPGLLNKWNLKDSLR